MQVASLLLKKLNETAAICFSKIVQHFQQLRWYLAFCVLKRNTALGNYAMYCNFKMTVKKWKTRLQIADSHCHANPDKILQLFVTCRIMVFPLYLLHQIILSCISLKNGNIAVSPCLYCMEYLMAFCVIPSVRLIKNSKRACTAYTVYWLSI